MIIAIHQPNFAPWLGYFEKMRRADIFVLLDDVDFSKNSYTNRVRIKDDRWLSVPVKARLGTPISEIPMANVKFTESHRGILRAAYKGSPQLDEFIEVERRVVGTSERLLDLNLAVLHYLRGRLGVATPLVQSSSLSVRGTSTARLVSIVSALGGDTYLSGSGGRNYQDERLFEESGITVQHLQYGGLQFGPAAGYSALHALLSSDAPGPQEAGTR